MYAALRRKEKEFCISIARPVWSIMSKKHSSNYWCTVKGGGQREGRKRGREGGKREGEIGERALWRLCVCSACNKGTDEEAVVETANLHLRHTEKRQC